MSLAKGAFASNLDGGDSGLAHYYSPQRLMVRHNNGMVGNRLRSPLAAWFNVIFCGGLIAAMIVMGITTTPFGYVAAVIAAGLEVVFVRRLIAPKVPHTPHTHD